MDYNPASNTVTPELKIDSGPLVKVRVLGAKVSNGKLQTLLPIYQERSVDRDLLEEGSRDLAEYFQSQGYFDAGVTYATASGSGAEEYIDYVVEKVPP